MKKALTASIFLLFLAACSTVAPPTADITTEANALQTTAVGAAIPYSIVDGRNSRSASLLKDGKTGTTAAQSWQNPGNLFADSSYPMTANIDLGASYDITGLEIFVGELQTTPKLVVQVSNDKVNYQTLTTPFKYIYNAPSVVDVASTGRYLRLSFNSRYERFFMSEFRVYGEKKDASVKVTTAKVVLAPNTRKADAALRSSITAFNGSQLTVSSSAPKLAVGQVLISDPTAVMPDGLLAKITGFTSTGYTVTDASLEEAFTDLDIVVSKDLNASDAVAAGGTSFGTNALSTQTTTLFDINESFNNKVICDADGNLNTKSDQIVASGSFRANVKYDLDIKVKLRRSFINVGTTIDENSSLSISGDCNKAFSKRYDIYNREYKPFKILGFPLRFTPYVRIFIGADGKVGGRADIRITQDYSAKYGVRFENGSWNATSVPGKPTFTAERLQFEGNTDVRGYVEATTGVKIGKIGSVYIVPEPFLKAKGTLSNGCKLLTYSGNYGLGFSAGSNLNFKFLGLKVDKGYTKDFGDFIDKQFLAGTSGKLGPC